MPETTTGEGIEAARRLLGHLDASPTPYHAVATAADLLTAAGFAEVDEGDAWAGDLADRWFVRRGGALVAADWPAGTAPEAPLRIVGAHTDSPNLRLKPRPGSPSAGWQRLAVEVYGGALHNSWLDRDLGLAGRVSVRGSGGVRSELVRLDGAVARIPQLAIHLDREANQGLTLNPQQHLQPLWAADGDADVLAAVAAAVEAEVDDLLAWDLMLFDAQPAALTGPNDELVAGGRLDDLLSSFAAIEALAAGEADGTVGVVCLFDHEEVGSVSRTGADGDLLPGLVRRAHGARGGDADQLARAFSASACVSADMAHATHPNYAERHDPGHPIRLNGGPVVKVNASQRYATDADSAVPFLEAADAAGVPVQRFVSRSDMPCGSTIGPVTAARMGVATVDVGVAQLAMHSARETAGSHDVGRFVDVLGAFLRP
ncbi:MAG TPA: M18 family aminopeptidase [Acidimicrobiales bacterium]|nr:M18 family aminopeptidase [Acidimicrobiales bacterium]